MFDFHSDYTSIRFSQELITLRAEGNGTERKRGRRQRKRMITGDESLSLKGLQVLANECTSVTVANETAYKVNVQRTR